MKLFTKIALGISGFFFGVSMICFVIALSMGVTVKDIKTMVRDGKFSFGPEDGFYISFGDDNDVSIGGENLENHHEDTHHSKDDYRNHEITHVCTILNVKLGAGKVDIYYDDVPNVQIKQKNIPGFKITSNDKERMLRIEGDINVVDNSDAALTIILPKDVKLEKIYLEIGASAAKVQDIIVDEFTFLIGAGQATVSNVSASEFDIEVGAGEAIVKNLSTRNLEVEVGVGEVDIEVAGAETDYSYDVDCGIGEVTVDNRSFVGTGAEKSITNMGATNHMDIDCGIGKVNIHFVCNVTDGI